MVARRLQRFLVMPSPSANKDEVRELLGEVDDLIIERIVDTGASIDEIAEALGGLVDEYGFGEQSSMPSSTRVTEVRALLDEIVFEDDEADDDVVELSS
jgi:hypothetical protein